MNTNIIILFGFPKCLGEISIAIGVGDGRGRGRGKIRGKSDGILANSCFLFFFVCLFVCLFFFFLGGACQLSCTPNPELEYRTDFGRTGKKKRSARIPPPPPARSAQLVHAGLAGIRAWIRDSGQNCATPPPPPPKKKKKKKKNELVPYAYVYRLYPLLIIPGLVFNIAQCRAMPPPPIGGRTRCSRKPTRKRVSKSGVGAESADREKGHGIKITENAGKMVFKLLWSEFSRATIRGKGR